MQLCSEILTLVPGYNAWNAASVIRALAPVFPKPSGVKFGRKGSPVLYASVPFWTHPGSRMERRQNARAHFGGGAEGYR